jgi:drug/metabolite transporter (DMT)-like permease
MIYLIIVSVIWALSFSLIKGNLTSIDPFFVSFIRLFISFLIFLPFLRFKNIDKKLLPHLLIIGIIQYGLMYIAYIYAYQYLKAYEIIILTIFTPIFIVITFDIWGKKFKSSNWIKALLAIIGSGIILYSENTEIGFWKGILLIQVSNILFAIGQVYYKKLVVKNSFIEQRDNYAVIFLGGTFITGIFTFSATNFIELEVSINQWLSLLYLGGIATGLGFFLWNVGVTKVNDGSLAVMNNLKIPLGVIFAVLILNESFNLIQLSVGSIFILIALFVKLKEQKF